MSFWRYRSLFIMMVLVLSACTLVDDYMLGKDNTPEPAALGAITPQMTLIEKWSVMTGKMSADTRLEPVIQGGVIYTASVDGTVQAIDKIQGKLLWSKQFPLRFVSGPTVGNGSLVLATNASSLLVLKQADGSKLWQANLSGDVLAKPVIADHDVFMKTIDGNVYAFNLKTGEKRWVLDHGSPNLILKASSSPVIMDTLVLVGFSDGKLDAVERQTGRVLWQRNLAYSSGGSDGEHLVDIDASPIVHDDVVYLASYQGYIGAMSLKDGEFIWRKPASIYKNMVMKGDTLYYVDADNTVWARNRLTGHVQWKQEVLHARGLTEPVLMANRLWVGDKYGYLHGLALGNGQVISRTFLHAPLFAAPVVSGSSLYVLSANGQLSRLIY